MIRNCNDGTEKEPYLRIDLNINNCVDIPDYCTGPKGNLEEIHVAIKEAGYNGVQDGDLDLCRNLGLGITAHARVNRPGELVELVKGWKDNGYDCSTLHVGWGMETDMEMDTMAAEILDLSHKYNYPLYIETHRATITQDMYRTVKLVERFPELRFNGDFSHWYTGQEMVYGGFEKKLEFINPVLDRVRYMHLRIGNPGCIQVDLRERESAPYVGHFREIWKRAFEGFLESALPGDYICVAPELLPSGVYYARTFLQEDREVEEGDRWAQAQYLVKAAKLSWDEVIKNL